MLKFWSVFFLTALVCLASSISYVQGVEVSAGLSPAPEDLVDVPIPEGEGVSPGMSSRELEALVSEGAEESVPETDDESVPEAEEEEEEESAEPVGDLGPDPDAEASAEESFEGQGALRRFLAGQNRNEQGLENANDANVV